jgi:hypothetical protein
MLGDPNDQSLKEYIVTLRDFNDSESFYEDMETPGGNLYIPDRAVDCANRRQASRNTHYMLTYDEAKQVMADPRILTVELNPRDLGLEVGTYGFTQTSNNFDKRAASDANDINWGLLRCVRKQDIPNWGIDGTPSVSGTVTVDATGKNVDVVIMDDGCPYPNTLEYQSNIDGSGYSRMIEFNWLSLNPQVTGGAAGQYSYTTRRLQEHGSHTTGTVAGNTQGWARDANIYNITYFDDPQYVKQFHLTKSINLFTGVKNPTVMNNSWGYRLSSWALRNISAIRHRGISYSPDSGSPGSYVWNPVVLDLCRVPNPSLMGTTPAIPIRVASVDADFDDLTESGVIVVASAGNSYWYCAVPGDSDWDNFLIHNGTTYFYHRGSSPGSANNAVSGKSETATICVGAIGPHNEVGNASIYTASGLTIGDYKSEFSNYGPRIDVYAPGSAIQSIWNSGTTLYDNTAAADPRLGSQGGSALTNNFKKCPGTSMSGPQVAGILACIAERYPNMTQKEAREYIAQYSQPTVLSTFGGPSDKLDAGFDYNPDSTNLHLYYHGDRTQDNQLIGTPWPRISVKTRPTTGSVYPRISTKQRTSPEFSINWSSNRNNAFEKSYPILSAGESIRILANTVGLSPTQTYNLAYTITAKPIASTGLIDTGFTGIFTSNTQIQGTEAFAARLNTTWTITTQDVGGVISGTVSSSTLSSEMGAVGTLVTERTTGSSDDGFFQITTPFDVSFAGVSYPAIVVGTNGYVTFGGGSTTYFDLDSNNPPLPKIMLSAADNSVQRIYHSEFGVAPNRTFVVRVEGTNATAGAAGFPNMVSEYVFYEATPWQIDVRMVSNARLVGDSATYTITTGDINVPFTGTFPIANNSGLIDITHSISSQSPGTIIEWTLRVSTGSNYVWRIEY